MGHTAKVKKSRNNSCYSDVGQTIAPEEACAGPVGGTVSIGLLTLTALHKHKVYMDDIVLGSFEANQKCRHINLVFERPLFAIIGEVLLYGDSSSLRWSRVKKSGSGSLSESSGWLARNSLGQAAHAI